MRERLRQLPAFLREFWQKRKRQERIIISLSAIVGAIIIVVLLAIAVKSSRRQIVPLFRGLSPEDVSKITGILKEQSVYYELRNAGQEIWVFEKGRDELRIQIASQGLPKGGAVGFELFDATKLGVTDFQEKVQYKRALEGELSRTIMGLDSVQEARVLVVIPEQELFLDDKEAASASVALKIVPGKQLNEDQIRGIQYLVSRSVKSLDPKDVTIIDEKGALLTDELDSKKEEKKLAQLTAIQLKTKQNYETQMQEKVQSMLEQMFGKSNAVVRVSMELNFDKQSIENEEYIPVVGDEGVVRSTSNKEEKFKGTGTAPEIGVPGTTSNIPGYKEVVPGNTEYSNSEEIKNFEISKKVTRTEQSQPLVSHVSVAVVINRDDLKPLTLDDIRETVVAAGSLDTSPAPGRADTVSVKHMKFDTTLADSVREEQLQHDRDERFKRNFSYGLIAAAILLAIIVSIMLLRPATIVKEISPAEVPAELIGEDLYPEELPFEEGEDEEEKGTGYMMPEASETEKIRDKVRERVFALVADDPESAAQIIKTWLIEGED